MFFGQVNAQTTLPIYVHMRLMNSKFLGRLYTSRVACLFLCSTTAAFLLLLRNVRRLASRKFYCEASFTLPTVLLLEVYMCDSLLHSQIFLLCIPLSTPITSRN